MNGYPFAPDSGLYRFAFSATVAVRQHIHVARHALLREATAEALRHIRRRLSRQEGEDLIFNADVSEDFREGMDAFLNKRTPSWKGK